MENVLAKSSSHQGEHPTAISSSVRPPWPLSRSRCSVSPPDRVISAAINSSRGQFSNCGKERGDDDDEADKRVFCLVGEFLGSPSRVGVRRRAHGTRGRLISWKSESKEELTGCKSEDYVT